MYRPVPLRIYLWEDCNYPKHDIDPVFTSSDSDDSDTGTVKT